MKAFCEEQAESGELIHWNLSNILSNIDEDSEIKHMMNDNLVLWI